MPFKRRFKDKYAGSLPEKASVVRTLFDLLTCVSFDKRVFKYVSASLLEGLSVHPYVCVFNNAKKKHHHLIRARIGAWVIMDVTISFISNA